MNLIIITLESLFQFLYYTNLFFSCWLTSNIMFMIVINIYILLSVFKGLYFRFYLSL